MLDEPSEQDGSAVPAFELVKEQDVAENDAVSCIGCPFADNVTPVKVYDPAPNEPTGTESVAEPVRFKVPLAGGLENVTVILAVKVSSVALFGVPLSLQFEKLLTLMLLTVHVGGATTEQEAGAVPALLFVNVHAGVAENAAVRAMGVPSALIETALKV